MAVGVEAGGLAVKWRKAGVDAAGQGGIGGLARQRLDTNLQGDTLGDVRHRENVF